MTKTTAKIKIVAVPAGEAPEHVREQWVGLELPLIPDHSHGSLRNLDAQGVITQRETVVHSAFVVNAREAIDLLAAKHPRAGNWWKQTGWYHEPGAMLVFRAEECELLGEFPNH